jgi:hypothetical protein
MALVHEHRIHHDPMQPCSEHRFRPKSADHTEGLHELFLSQVFGDATVTRTQHDARKNSPFLLSGAFSSCLFVVRR